MVSEQAMLEAGTGLLSVAVVKREPTGVHLGLEKKKAFKAWLTRGYPEAEIAYCEDMRAAAVVVKEVKSSWWEKFWEAGEKDFQLASRKSKPFCSVPALLSQEGELLIQTGDIVGRLKEHGGIP